MAKKTITEYEPVEETTEKVRCDECETRWDDRSASDANTVVLNLRLQRKGRSGWTDESFFGGLYGNRTHRLAGDGFKDLCNTCLDEMLADSEMVSIDGTEYHVEEETREVYYCDFDETEMGTEPTHTVTINPRVVQEKRILSTSPQGDTTIRQLGETFSGNRYTSYSLKKGQEFDMCQQCASEIFGIRASTNLDRSFLSGVYAGLTQFFRKT